MKTILLFFLCIGMAMPSFATVDLVYFTAQSSSGNVHLQWATSGEYNNALFFIERSMDADSWTTVQSVPGSGNSSILVEYETVDASAGTGTRYYRLRQMEITGVNEYSDVISVYVTPGPPTSLSVFPNPAGDELVVEVDDSWVGKVSILNAIGQIMIEQPHNGDRSFNLDVNELPEGMYYVQIESGDQRLMKKFFKK